MIFDTHTHYDDEAYDADRASVLNALSANGIVGRICNIGASMAGVRASVALSEKYDFVYAATGVHPDEVHELNDDTWAELRELVKARKAVAVGEIGLDYHGFDIYENKPDKETQKYWFEKQLDLAVEMDKPVVIHSRNAAADTLEFMQKAHDRGLKDAVIHCYSYSREMALEYIRLGYYIGIGGVLTYEGQKKVTKAISEIPMDRLLIETDCPYLTPVPLRPGRNHSEYLTYVVAKIADLRGLTAAEVEQITWDNANRFYRIS